MAEILIAFRDIHSDQYNQIIIEYDHGEISITFDNGFYTYTNSKYILIDLTSDEIIKMVIDLCLLPDWKSIFLLNGKDL